MSHRNKTNLLCLMLLLLAFSSFKCSKDNDNEDTKPVIVTKSDVDFYLTSANQTSLLKKQNFKLRFGTATNSYPIIRVDSTQVFQEIDGFGYSLTGGSSSVIYALAPAPRAALLKEMFGSDSASLGISYLRISIGASDLDPFPFSYNDLPAGETDVNLNKFSLAPDKAHLIPVLKEILAINPNIKIMGSPWSPPTWMKTNNSSVGGSLKPEYYSTYAQYFVKYIQGMKAEGITIDAVTLQNEPLHPGNNPSLLMQAAEQRDFIKGFVGPAFEAAGIKTKIIVYDHNCDRPDYPITILNDPEAKKYVDGSAFHLYGGDISALSTVHDAHPDRNLYFTEQWTGKNESFAENFMWHTQQVLIGSVRNWSKVVLEWNLANDPSFGPHTEGGCTECKGALTIGGSITRNPSYYILGQISKWVPPGSKRIQSDIAPNMPSVAFLTPQGKKVLLVLNTASASQSFNIEFKGKRVTALLQAQSAGTFIW
ncbi:MAG: glycoside hydrolase family 30 beta sandwich domain-containing protein [Saprospiraceae bacterium]|uniref:glycoside hydrolase family 30 protein n=1 Tax=Candidatus Brachybacter algidus TaxID=2982024 RepID=UPI00257EA89D|nr:glycoside hydrolase family 30 beta sandwich domain-containing protein [Candidatus Brachybacter algidus]